MKKSGKKRDSFRLILDAETAGELMTPNPVSVSEHTMIREAAVALTNREISAFPVINEAGQPVGVLSRADIVRHHSKAMAAADVRKIMTPTVISVATHDPAWEAIAKMTAFKVHRLFVVNGTGTLIGVITSFDVVRKLRREESATT
jgi:CBS domain-containing protein